MSVLPTFFVIGAAKSGTTSFHSYLAAHPELDMSSVKEPAVFASGGALDSGYAHLFTGRGRQRGESSAVYSQFPRWPGIPERIAQAVPEARFVYLVRDPIERAVAHHAQHVADGKERRPLVEALADWEREDSLYICPSRYATQLKQYLRHFDETRFIVIDQRELLSDRRSCLERVFAFLEVDAAFDDAAFDRELNPSRAKRTPTNVGRRLEDTALYRFARSARLPGPVRSSIRRVVSRPVRGSLPEPLAAPLREGLYDEVAWLRGFSGQGFGSWSL